VNDTGHAALLLALPAAAAVACAVRPAKPDKVRLLSAAVALPLLAVLGLLQWHSCQEGRAYLQWVIPSLCALAGILFIRWWKPALGLALVQVGSMTFLTTNYHELVHGPVYTGNRDWERFAAPMRDHQLNVLRGAVGRAGATQEASYPAGWLRTVPLAASMEEHDLGGFVSRRYDPPVPLWHTGFTGLYLERSVAVGVWFPGGTLAAGASGLAWKDLSE
jgi:hypothetical protein